MSATSGKIALVSSTTALSGTCPTSGTIIDLVGYGSANCFEGTGGAPTLSNTSAALCFDLHYVTDAAAFGKLKVLHAEMTRRTARTSRSRSRSTRSG